MPSLEKKRKPSTVLSDVEIEQLIKLVRNHLKSYPAINNRTLRALSGIGYDQAINFFNSMVEKKLLFREGKGSGVKYTLPPESDSKNIDATTQHMQE
jgi:hypothetical protein